MAQFEKFEKNENKERVDTKNIYVILISEIEVLCYNYKIYKLDPKYIIWGWV